MDKYNVGILGATGAVGREMLKILRERSFPVGELRLLASKRSAGKEIDGYEVLEACAENFRGLNIVLGAAENNIAAAFADDIKAAGAVFVDNSSAFRLCPDVPLVVPEINPEDVKKHSGIIANPNCTTTITCTAISALRRLSPIESMVVSSYQAVSGAGSAVSLSAVRRSALHLSLRLCGADRRSTIEANPGRPSGPLLSCRRGRGPGRC